MTILYTPYWKHHYVYFFFKLHAESFNKSNKFFLPMSLSFHRHLTFTLDYVFCENINFLYRIFVCLGFFGISIYRGVPKEQILGNRLAQSLSTISIYTCYIFLFIVVFYYFFCKFNVWRIKCIIHQVTDSKTISLHDLL